MYIVTMCFCRPFSVSISSTVCFRKCLTVHLLRNVATTIATYLLLIFCHLFLKKDVDHEQGEKKRGEDSSCERMKVRVDKKDCLKRKGACPSPSTRI